MATKPMLDHTIRKDSDHEYSNIIMRNFNNVSNAVDFFDFILFLGIPKWLLIKKKSACQCRRRSSGEVNGNPLQYSCLGNTMNRRAWQVTVRGISRVEHARTWRPTLQLKLDKLNKKLLKSYKRFLKLGIRHITVHFFKLQRFSALSFHLFLYMSSFFFPHELSSSFCLINK